MQALLFNGAAWPMNWSTISNWTVRVVLQPGTNQWTVLGVDPRGQHVPGVSTIVAAVYNANATSPVGQVVINEIMYNPPISGAEYIECYNNSSTLSLDLSNWQFKGLSYTFPPGSLIGPKGFLILAANRAAFAAAYGATNAVFDVFTGTLQSDGETLTLVMPATSTNPELVVTKVKYASSSPWPSGANGNGSSLQLIDAAQDNWRVGNWAAASKNGPSGSGTKWAYVTTTGIAASSRLNLYLQSPGFLYVDDLKLVAGTVPEAGANRISNGDFESTLAGTWNLGPDFIDSGTTTAVEHSGSSSLALICNGTGNSNGDAAYQDIVPPLGLGQTYTLSFWYLQTTNANAPNLAAELSGSGLRSWARQPDRARSKFCGRPSYTKHLQQRRRGTACISSTLDK